MHPVLIESPTSVTPDVDPGHTALQLLCETFGVEFRIGTRSNDDWEVVVDGASNDSALIAAVAMLHGRPQRTVVPTDDGRLLIAVPLPGPGDCLAVGLFDSSDEPLAHRLAAGAERLLQQHQQLARSEHDLADCLEQLTFSMEEQSWLRSLSRQVEDCSARLELPEIAATILPRLCTLIGAESLAFLPADIADRPATAEARIRWTGGRSLSIAQCRKFLAAYGVRAVDRAVVAQEADAPELFGPLELQSLILVPIAHRNGISGWLFAANRNSAIVPLERNDNSRSTTDNDGEFGSVEAGLLEATATMLSTHVRTADALQQREDLIFRLMRTMSSAIDARDAYTRGHSQRVGRYAMEIGRQLALDHHECQQILLTGLLHDLGKIGVPDHVLLKPGRLTSDEFDLIKMHPEIGHRILQPIPELAFALPGVLHHHERIDGCGYPHGLSGDDIPLQARILAVADAFDAMTSSRTYRAAMSEEKARAILLEGAGIQWDTDVVDAFLKVSDLRAISEGAGSDELVDVSPSIFEDEDDDPGRWQNPSMILTSPLLEPTEVMA